MVANNLVAVGDIGDAHMQAVYYNCGLFAYDTFAESLLTVNPMPGENVFQGNFQTFAETYSNSRHLLLRLQSMWRLAPIILIVQVSPWNLSWKILVTLLPISRKSKILPNLFMRWWGKSTVKLPKPNCLPRNDQHCFSNFQSQLVIFNTKLIDCSSRLND